MMTQIEKIIMKNEPLRGHSTYRNAETPGFSPCLQISMNYLTSFATLFKQVFQCFILGSGSNILFPDKPGKDRLYISLKNIIDIKPAHGGLWVSAGTPLSILSIAGCLLYDDNMLFTYLLPGTLGAGIYMNAKCYGKSVLQNS